MQSLNIMFASTRDKPTGLLEGVNVAPSLAEFIKMDLNDITHQMHAGITSVDRSSAQAFLQKNPTVQMEAIMSLSWEQQSDFISAWVGSQSDLIAEGRFDELVAVPVFGELMEKELDNLLNTALRERRELTEEEINTATFLSLAAGFTEIEYSPSQLNILESIRKEETPPKEDTGGALGVVKDITGAIPTISLQGKDVRGKEDERSETEKLILEQQDLLRGNIPPGFEEKILSGEGAGLYIIGTKMMEGFELGEKVSRPLTRDILQPLLTRMVETSAPIQAASLTTPGVNIGLEGAGVPDISTGSVTIPTGDIPLLPDITTPDVGVTRAIDPKTAATDVINSKIVEVAGMELLNPANVMFAIPFIGPGSRFARAMQTGTRLRAFAILADEFALTGNTPGIAGGLARGLGSTTRIGLNKTLARWPWLARNPDFIRMMQGFENTRLGHAQTKAFSQIKLATLLK